jgi:hypothetical protein
MGIWGVKMITCPNCGEEFDSVDIIQNSIENLDTNFYCPHCKRSLVDI